MDVYQNIWSSCDKTQLDKHNHFVTDAVVNQGLFQREDDKFLKVHVREVNSLLNNNKTRDRGFRLLADLLPQCAHQVLSVQCERWFRFCCDAVTGLHRGKRVVQACQLLCALLRDLPSLPELQRCVAAKSSASIVPELAAADPLANPAALECLYEYIRAAPGPCLQHKNILEERMLSHLDHPVTPASLGGGVARQAGRVLAALPLPGVGGGNVAQSRADARGRQLALLLALAHSLMDTLLDGVLEKESFTYSRDYSSLKLRPLEDVTPDPMTSRLVSIVRLSNTLTFVGEMVTDTANASITIASDHLLSVVYRLLQMEPEVLSRYRSQEHKLVAFFLPSLHNRALLLLKDITASLSDGIDSYHNISTDIIVNIIRAYKSTGAKDERSPWCSGGLQTRVLAYGVLAEVLRGSHGRHTPPSGLVSMLVQDASPQERRVKLQEKGLAGLSLTKGTSKKKGYTVTSQTSGGNSGPLPRPGSFGRLARVSLVVAEMLFTHATHSMHFEDHQLLQNGVLAIAEGVVGASHPPDIYADPRVRVQLCHTLAALCAAPHPRCPPPYALLSHLLHTGCQDSDTQVASVCQTALCGLSLVTANPKVELASQAFHQHQQHHPSTEEHRDVEEDVEVDMIVEQLQEEEEVEEVVEEEVGEEEEQEKGDEKVWENRESDKEEEHEKDEKRNKEKENGGNKREKGKGRNEKEREREEEEDENAKKGENKKGDKGKGKETQEIGRNTRKRGKNRQRRKEKEGTDGKGAREEEEEAEVMQEGDGKGKKKGSQEEVKSSSPGKRNGSKSDPPSKRVKAGSDEASGREGAARELTVDEMLQDFVEG